MEIDNELNPAIEEARKLRIESQKMREKAAAIREVARAARLEELKRKEELIRERDRIMGLMGLLNPIQTASRR